MDPSFMDYLMRLRATREKDDQEFRKRRDAAVIAKAAVDEQGVGE
jgi:hypothetical protein